MFFSLLTALALLGQPPVSKDDDQIYYATGVLVEICIDDSFTSPTYKLIIQRNSTFPAKEREREYTFQKCEIYTQNRRLTGFTPEDLYPGMTVSVTSPTHSIWHNCDIIIMEDPLEDFQFNIAQEEFILSTQRYLNKFPLEIQEMGLRLGVKSFREREQTEWRILTHPNKFLILAWALRVPDREVRMRAERALSREKSKYLLRVPEPTYQVPPEPSIIPMWFTREA